MTIKQKRADAPHHADCANDGEFSLKPIQVTEMPIQSPAADGAVVRVESVRVRRSDWHFWNQDLGWIGNSISSCQPIPATKVGGVVEKVGRDVRAIKVVDRVTFPFTSPTESCPEVHAVVIRTYATT